MSTTKTQPFDPAKYLDTPEAIAAYMTEARKTGDPSFVADALEVSARALSEPHKKPGAPSSARSA